MDWQLIETYDYKNTPVVLLAAKIKPSESAARNGSKSFWDVGLGRVSYEGRFTGILGGNPSHWMPLPTPPEEEMK